MPSTELRKPWPKALDERLDQLRAIPYGKVVPNALIDGIVFELAKLPPSSVPWAGYRVAVWAGLWSDYDPRSRQTGCLFPFRRRQVTPLDWLKANPRLAPLAVAVFRITSPVANLGVVIYCALLK